MPILSQFINFMCSRRRDIVSVGINDMRHVRSQTCRNRNREPATAKYAVTKDGVAAQGLGAKAVLEDSVSGQRLSLDLRVYKGGQVRIDFTSHCCGSFLWLIGRP